MVHTHNPQSRVRLGVFIASLLCAGLSFAAGQLALAQGEGLLGKIDLRTTKGVEEVKGEWRYAEVTTGVGEKKNEIEPKAHGKYDDSKWEVLKPETLGNPRGPGGYSWCWYRIQITIPETIKGKPFEQGPVWFYTTVDDYGEVWVDGKIDLSFGKSGRGAVSGFNTMNRVRLQKEVKVKDEKSGKEKTVKVDAKPGDVFQIAILGINSPLGNPPGNFIFLRDTGLEFFSKEATDQGANKPRVEPPPSGKEVAKINLMDQAGVDLVKGAWKRRDIEVHVGPKKNEIAPKAHGKFDDSQWETVDPAKLKDPYGVGKFSMAWYRIKVTVPEKVGEVSTAGKALWFRTTVDDYAEIWVNGSCELAFGSSGRGAISGFNTPNEVKLTDNAKPGEEFQIAVLAINSPFGNPPGNFIFFRAPTELRFFEKTTTKKKADKN